MHNNRHNRETMIILQTIIVLTKFIVIASLALIALVFDSHLQESFASPAPLSSPNVLMSALYHSST